jgi:hypothetical protein
MSRQSEDVHSVCKFSICKLRLAITHGPDEEPATFMGGLHDVTYGK